MSAADSEPSDDLTPEQRRQQVIAILARGVMRRVRWLRRSPSMEKHDPSVSADPRADLLLVNREILV